MYWGRSSKKPKHRIGVNVLDVEAQQDSKVFIPQLLMLHQNKVSFVERNISFLRHNMKWLL